MKAHDLETRLIKYTISVVKYAESLNKGLFEQYLTGQLIRSATSPSLNYGEAQAAGSKKDFLHKMKVCLKELKETLNSLKLLREYKAYEGQKAADERLDKITDETRQLSAIFYKSVQTASQSGN